MGFWIAAPSPSESGSGMIPLPLNSLHYGWASFGDDGHFRGVSLPPLRHIAFCHLSAQLLSLLHQRPHRRLPPSLSPHRPLPPRPGPNCPQPPQHPRPCHQHHLQPPNVWLPCCERAVWLACQSYMTSTNHGMLWSELPGACGRHCSPPIP